MKIVLASRNRHKIAELQAFLSPVDPEIEILSLDDIGFSGDIEEDGQTFEENALIKARVPASLGYIGVADDSGLAVDALDGAPG
ncbi:MAG: non-canonical purine NTP pyrophosphatase, partial [Clostridia bacterium]|nr:non-canonical purine NTP pyrophosphatase [Clostridia bacterium]